MFGYYPLIGLLVRWNKGFGYYSYHQSRGVIPMTRQAIYEGTPSTDRRLQVLLHICKSEGHREQC